MTNKYTNFITDEHLLSCIAILHKDYIKAKEKVSLKNFYSNKVDTIKLTFDAQFSNESEEAIIKAEIQRQMDKSINNSIGTFHEHILGGIKGYSVGYKDGYDIKADDDTLFADIKNKHNTMNSSASESLFQKLKTLADTHKKARCYWVQILATKSINEPWQGEINGKEYSHSRVFKISGDQFYSILSNQEDALYQLYSALPTAINDYLAQSSSKESVMENSVLEEINRLALDSNRRILDQITFDNFNFYSGFDKL